MAIISVLVFYVSVEGILVFNKVHYSDIMNNAKEKMTSIMNKVEVSSDNIIDELTWHLSTPEQVISTLEYELNTNNQTGNSNKLVITVGKWMRFYDNFFIDIIFS